MTETLVPAADPDAPLTRRACFGFGIGALGTALLLNTVSTFLPAFMTTVLGQSAGLAGLLMTVSKLYDVLADIVIGVASDRTRSRWGRRRPYLLAGAILAAMSVLMIFLPPATGDSFLLVWMPAALILYSTGYSLFGVPYIALAGEMTGGYHERTRLLSYHAFFASLGQLAASGGAAAVIRWQGGGPHGYAVMGAAVASVIFTTMILCFFGTLKARRVERTIATGIPRGDQIRTVLANRPFVLLMSAKMCQYLAISIVSTTKLLFLLNILGVGYAGLILLTTVQNVVAAATVPLWAVIARRTGKAAAFRAAIVCLIVVYVSWYWGDASITGAGLVARGVLNGVAAAGMTVLGTAMLPDIMEMDRRRTGLRREGMFSAIYAFVEKLSFAAGPGLIGILLAVSGYVPSTNGRIVAQPASALATLYAGMSLIPATLVLVSLVLMMRYRLGEAELARA